MKIIFAIDAIKYPLTGICRYAIEIAYQLASAPNIENLYFFYCLKIKSSLPSNLIKPKEILLKKWFCKNKIFIKTYQSLYSWLQYCILRNYSDYIYHSPNYYLPRGLSRSIVTFHDVSIFTCPQYHPRERVLYLSKAMQHSLCRASRIITVSSFSKCELASYFNYPANKIDITPLACSKAFHPRCYSKISPLMFKLGLKCYHYTLFVGTIEPRKNLVRLCNAYEKLPNTLKQRYPLVISGYAGWNSDNEHKIFERGKREKWLIYLGYVESVNLPLLFAAARLFVFPSLYEGFGLPVLEAMASGVPVVCSNIAALLEIEGNAALTCNPMDVDALSLRIEKGLQDYAWRSQAKLAGLSRASKFSWNRCLQNTIKAYLKV